MVRIGADICIVGVVSEEHKKYFDEDDIFENHEGQNVINLGSEDGVRCLESEGEYEIDISRLPKGIKKVQTMWC